MLKSSRVLKVSRAATAAALLLWSSAGSAQVTARTPNLKPFPAYAFGLAANSSGGTNLIFSMTSWNNGLGPLELVAGARDSATLRQTVYQRIYNSDGTYTNYLAGTFVWHPLHDHVHFEDYALYTLQPATANGASDRTSSKTTFCVMDTDHVDGSLPGSPSLPRYATCGASVQGLSVGWGDTYGRLLAGQGIDVTGLPEGDYRLVVEVDPRKRIIETNEDDNVSCVLLHIRSPTSVTVLNGNGCTAPVVTPPAVVTVSGITPSFGTQGTSFPATITGTNFAPGMAVTFENGSNPRPIASNVRVVNATTITATIAIKSGGKQSDRVWDLRVGSGVRVNAFTVNPP